MMDIDIQGHNLKVTEALSAYVHKKLDKLDRYLPNIMEVRVELGREHTKRGEDLSVAQITVRHQRGAILRAQETIGGEIEAALNLAVDKMYRQIQRFKGKRIRKGRGSFSASLEELDIAEAIPEVEVFEESRRRSGRAADYPAQGHRDHGDERGRSHRADGTARSHLLHVLQRGDRQHQRDLQAAQRRLRLARPARRINLLLGAAIKSLPPTLLTTFSAAANTS